MALLSVCQSHCGFDSFGVASTLQTYHTLAEIFHPEPHVVIAQLDAKLNERIGHR